MTHGFPILYSFRRCPYAMRSRMGLAYANIKCELREVVLRNKPPEMTAVSAKNTVPILCLPDGQIIDESYDIITWAIRQNDPKDWTALLPQSDILVSENDGTFKSALDKYKYSSRFPDHPPEYYRDEGAIFLNKLENILHQSPYLLGQRQSPADIAIFPFIRQFAHVDKNWFYEGPYPNLLRWLTGHLESDQFRLIMKKYPPWQQEDDPVYFPDLYQGLIPPLVHSVNNDNM